MEIIINTNESNASLWIAIITFIIAFLSFLILYFKPHIMSKKNFWIEIESHYKLGYYDNIIDEVEKNNINSYYINQFQQIFSLFDNSKKLEGLYLKKIENQLNLIKKTNSNFSEILNMFWKSDQFQFWTFKNIEDINNNDYKNELHSILIENKNNFNKLKDLLTSPPYNW